MKVFSERQRIGAHWAFFWMLCGAAHRGHAAVEDQWLGVRGSEKPTVDTRLSVATNTVVVGFNAIGGNAAALRRLMSQGDAEAFNAVMTDIMGALLALPAIAMRNSENLDAIAVKNPHPERVPQLMPDLHALQRFLIRIRRTHANSNDQRRLAAAEKAVQKMLSAVPVLLPTVEARSLGTAK